MKKALVILFVMLLLVMFSNPANAQDKEYRAFGLGVNLLDLSGLLSGNGASIYAPINLGPAFRIEPFLGFGTTSYDYKDSEADDSHSGFQFGTGVYPTIRRGNAVIYIGGRIGVYLSSDEYKNSQGDVDEEDSDFTFTIGPIVGGEYYFNPHISLGGEASIMYTHIHRKMDYKNELYTNDEETDTHIGTGSMIFFRFYF